MRRLILGTVQLGIPYGINNDVGKPNIKDAFSLLDYAYNSGIRILDTASAYGDSESIIGEYMNRTGNIFEISTKLAKIGHTTDANTFIKEQIEHSLRSLNKDCIEIYLLHSFNDLVDNVLILDQLRKLKFEGRVEKIGVSLYDPSELEYILSNCSNDIDVVQIPFNLLDCRWTKSNLLKRAKEQAIQIFARSVYLQGLLFVKDETKMDIIDPSLKGYLSKLREVAEDNKITMAQLALDYVRSYDEIDGILLGCETLKQLHENVELFANEVSVSSDDKNRILKLAQGVSSNMIDPRQWKK